MKLHNAIAIGLSSALKDFADDGGDLPKESGKQFFA
jgi:hypothetical protein